MYELNSTLCDAENLEDLKDAFFEHEMRTRWRPTAEDTTEQYLKRQEVISVRRKEIGYRLSLYFASLLKTISKNEPSSLSILFP